MKQGRVGEREAGSKEGAHERDGWERVRGRGGMRGGKEKKGHEMGSGGREEGCVGVNSRVLGRGRMDGRGYA